jgi:hypothetical protein
MWNLGKIKDMKLEGGLLRVERGRGKRLRDGKMDVVYDQSTLYACMKKSQWKAMLYKYTLIKI